MLKILAMIFGDLVCCVHFVVLFQSCTGGALVAASADLAPPTTSASATTGPGEVAQIVASPLVRQPVLGSPSNSNRTAVRLTDSFPGELNEYCRASEDCRQHAHVCDGRKQSCNCAEGYRPDETNRVCLGAVGRRCLYDSHCITNAYCKGQMICTCKREYGFATDDNWSCQASSAKASPRISKARQGALLQGLLVMSLLAASFLLVTIFKQQT